MRIHIAYEISYACPQPTPALLTLRVHPSRAHDLEKPDFIASRPSVPIRDYTDGFGNICSRLTLPVGRTTLTADAIVRDSGLPDPVAADAAQHAVEDLPSETLVFLVGSRYCEPDRLTETAWSLFGTTRPGWVRVQAICDYVHRHISFSHEHARWTKTASDAHIDGGGVCRDVGVPIMQPNLLGWRSRGGWRRGAGRKRTSRRVQHVSREAARNGVFHVTARVRSGLPSLRSARVVNRIEQSFRLGSERKDFRLVHYSLQRDHVHLVVEAADTRALGRGVRALLIRVARAANAVWRRRGAVIGDRYHHRRLVTPREVRNAIAYVLRNARKHLGGGAGRIDPASSGRWFWEASRETPSVASPRFWLLSVGWRRDGPIDP